MPRYHYYQKRQVKPQYNWHPFKSTKGSVITLALIMALIIYWGNTNSTLAYRTGQANMAATVISIKEDQTSRLTAENEALKQQLDFSSKIKVDDKTRDIVKGYIFQYFGAASPQAIKVFTCESGLSPMALNDKNYNQTQDRGISQINSVHAAQFKQVTGYDYTVFAHDSEQNIKFAKWLYDQSGWSPWVCSRLI